MTKTNKNMYENVSNKSEMIRRPMGERQIVTNVYASKISKDKIYVITGVRRPHFSSYGKVTKNNKIVFEGEKNDAEKFVKTNYGINN